MNQKTIIRITVFMAVLFALPAAASDQQKTNKKPNVVLIFADDMGTAFWVAAGIRS